jgi:AcrR family transcriptional regulator
MTTRERVLAAALASFGGRGYEATSLDQVAVELGIRKQTILYYAPSKAELLDAVIDASSAELAATLEARWPRPARGGPGSRRSSAPCSVRPPPARAARRAA